LNQSCVRPGFKVVLGRDGRPGAYRRGIGTLT
jgi:hypothetical protein